MKSPIEQKAMFEAKLQKLLFKARLVKDQIAGVEYELKRIDAVLAAEAAACAAKNTSESA